MERDLTNEIAAIKNIREDLTTKKLNELGLNSYYVKKLLDDGIIIKVDRGLYTYNNSNQSEEYYDKAIQFRCSKNYDKARYYYKKAVEADKHNERAYLCLIYDAIRNNNYALALDYIKEYSDNKQDVIFDELDNVILSLFNKLFLVPEYMTLQVKDVKDISLDGNLNKYFSKRGSAIFYNVLLALKIENYEEAKYYLYQMEDLHVNDELCLAKYNLIYLLISAIAYRKRVKKDKGEEQLDIKALFYDLYKSMRNGSYEYALFMAKSIQDYNIENKRFNITISDYIVILRRIINLYKNTDNNMEDYDIPNYDFTNRELCSIRLRNGNFKDAKSLVGILIKEEQDKYNTTEARNLKNIDRLIETYNVLVKFKNNITVPTIDVDYNKFKNYVNSNEFDKSYEVVKSADNLGLIRLLIAKLNSESLPSLEEKRKISHIDENLYKDEITQINSLIESKNFNGLSIYIASISLTEKMRLQFEAYVLEKMYMAGYENEAEVYYDDMVQSDKCNNILESILTLTHNKHSSEYN